MKKEYMKPFVVIVETEFQNLICWSGTGASVNDFSNDHSGNGYDDDGWPDDTEE